MLLGHLAGRDGLVDGKAGSVALLQQLLDPGLQACKVVAAGLPQQPQRLAGDIAKLFGPHFFLEVVRVRVTGNVTYLMSQEVGHQLGICIRRHPGVNHVLLSVHPPPAAHGPHPLEHLLLGDADLLPVLVQGANFGPLQQLIDRDPILSGCLTPQGAVNLLRGVIPGNGQFWRARPGLNAWHLLIVRQFSSLPLLSCSWFLWGRRRLLAGGLPARRIPSTSPDPATALTIALCSHCFPPPRSKTPAESADPAA